MLAEQALRIGPANVPVWLLAAVGACAAIAILLRTVWRNDRDRWSAANDALSSGLLAGFLVWKLTPLVTRFAEIRELPSRLLYYPGGTTGLVAGAVAGGLVVWLVVRRRGVARDRRAWFFLGLPVAAVATAVTLVAVIPVAGGVIVDATALDYLPGYELSYEPSNPTVITAWATWCGPCTAQMPEIDRFAAERDGEVNVIALNLTRTEPSIDAVRDYLSGSGLSFPVALDRSGAVVAGLEVRSTPTTIVFGPDGRERGRRTGAVNADWLARRVLPLGR